MAGLAAISLQQRTGIDGRPFPGARAQFLEAETLNPIAVWQDYGLGTPHANPVEADDYGVFPAIFIDEDIGFYRIRVTTATGVILTDLTTLPVIGPTGGGGGAEVPVDPNALFKTGFPLWLPVSGSLAGFVRMNGRTIGSAISGATERANSDCEALFSWTWSNHDNTRCPVTGGRGISSAADWAANKQIQLLNMRNKGPFGLDDMGNTAANGFTGVTFTNGNATTPGSAGGAGLQGLDIVNLPVLALGDYMNDLGHKHPGRTDSFNGGGNPALIPSNSGSGGATENGTSNAVTGITWDSFGGDQPHQNMPPFMLGTWQQKL